MALDGVAHGYRRLVRWPAAGYLTAGVLAVAALSEVALRHAEPPTGPSYPLLLALVGTAPVATARAHPVPSAAVATAGVLATLLIDEPPPVAALVAVPLAAYLAGRHASRLATTLLVLPWIAYAALPPAGGAPGGRTLGVLLLTLAGTAFAIGAARRAHDEATRQRAARRAAADAVAEHAIRGERVRIAHELHDVVAHHISMVALQIEAARFTTAGVTPELDRRLAAVGDTARAALVEMRRVLDVLRDDLRDDADLDLVRRPPPGLRELNELIDEARAATGVSTRLIVRGEVTPLDRGVELTTYRIVQEALTNARRHAPGAAVDVELEYRPDALRIRVRDNGPGPPPGDGGESGHGLAGMRERAAMLGGSVRTGRAARGGFLVEALLPGTEPVA